MSRMADTTSRCRRTLLLAAALFAVSVWGASFVATRVALTAFSPLDLVAVRTCIGAVVVFCLAGASGRRAIPGREAWRSILILGVILALHLLIQAHGLVHTTAIHTGWIIGFIPIVIVLGAALFLGERVSRRTWLGIVVATAGIGLILAQRPPDFAHARLGDLLQLLSCFTWAAYTLIAVRPLALHGSLAMTGGALAVAGVVLAVPAAAAGRLLTAAPSTAAIGAIAFLAVICSGVASVVWFHVLDGLGAQRTGVFLFVEPLATLATARVMLGEPLTVVGLAGGLTVLAGVAIVQRSRKNPKKGPPPRRRAEGSRR